MPAEIAANETTSRRAGANGQVNSPRRRVPASPLEQLTPREKQTFLLLTKGGYYRDIGEALGVRVCTVRAHLHSIYQKLQVKSRWQAVAKFQEQTLRPGN